MVIMTKWLIRANLCTSEMQLWGIVYVTAGACIRLMLLLCFLGQRRVKSYVLVHVVQCKDSGNIVLTITLAATLFIATPHEMQCSSA